MMADFHLDILGQQPRINRLYTQITFCFELRSDSLSQSEIIGTLQNGLQSLSESFPWIAGRIVNENETFKIKSCGKESRLVVKDYEKDRQMPQWDTLQEANFPFRLIDESTVAPCKTLESISDNLPVFLVQANFVVGGLLLTLNGQHGSMDMAGQDQMMYLLAKACRKEPFTSSELSICNMDRRNIVPLLNDNERDSVDDRSCKNHGVSSNTEAVQGQAERSPSCVWAYFAFAASSLATLKSLASASVPPGTCDFVSTDDVLSAFIWQSISRSRLPRYERETSTPKTTLSRNVDVRRYLSIPSTYPGLVTNATIHTSSLDDVLKQSFGTLALQLRSALDPELLSHRTRELATAIARDKNGQHAVPVPRGNPELDVRLSSWAKDNCYSLDFGFGLPVAVRRPRFAEGSREGLVYFLPKTLEGDIVVGICLRDEDLERLKGDQKFIQFGKFVG
jgi:trichothecene 3-O-acetyltransferase